MEEKLIEFDTAKLAKEKGLCDYFEDANPTNYVDAFYSEDGIQFEETEFMQEDCTIQDRYFRPTQSLLQKWLREVHNIDIDIWRNTLTEKYRMCEIFLNGNEVSLSEKIENTEYTTYEEALEVSLQEALKLIKTEEDGGKE